jgi:Pregnancy-associated plasma protein-A
MVTEKKLGRACGTDINHKRLLAQFGERYRKNMINEEQNWLRFASRVSRISEFPIVTIPTVIHVVYNNNKQNISDSQIQSQIEILNRDFRKMNSDVNKVPKVWNDLVADTRIEFRLARRDPEGNLTNGITRTHTNIDEFVYGEINPLPEKIKFTADGGKDAWDTTRYLNIWTCKIKTDNPLSSGLLGYAQFPAGGTAETDGVVINFAAFGTNGTAQSPFHLGRTTTHEVGHWLGLRHIWGHDFFDECSGTDNIADTPNQASSNRGKPSFPSMAQKCIDTDPNGTMFMNYMDYTDDDSMYMFTLGQSARMRATLASSRSSLLTSDALNSPIEEASLRNLRTLPSMVYDGIDSIVKIEELL